MRDTRRNVVLSGTARKVWSAVACAFSPAEWSSMLNALRTLTVTGRSVHRQRDARTLRPWTRKSNIPACCAFEA